MKYFCRINDFLDLIKNQGGWESDESKKEAALRETVEEAGVRGIIVGVSLLYQFIILSSIPTQYIIYKYM